MSGTVPHWNGTRGAGRRAAAGPRRGRQGRRRSAARMSQVPPARGRAAHQRSRRRFHQAVATRTERRRTRAARPTRGPGSEPASRRRGSPVYLAEHVGPSGNGIGPVVVVTQPHHSPAELFHQLLLAGVALLALGIVVRWSVNI